ncbi:MAG: hypothetical protein FWH44_02350 [Methanomassiliicoccaceae archaeon]|nr:hypothetical protein [Methanomassiliicoccaceae archaeon]
MDGKDVMAGGTETPHQPKSGRKRSDIVLTVIFAAVVAVVLIGEAYVYTAGDGRYASDIAWTDDGIEYSVTSKGSEQYSVLVMDNGSFEMINRLYIYYDEGYGSELEKVRVPVGAKALTQEYYISQLIATLNNRGVRNIEILNAAELKDALEDDITSSNASVKGLVVLSGALPETIYSTSVNLVLDWINDGGSLYWAGNFLGKYYATPGGTAEAVRNYEYDFFGKTGCLNEGGENAELSDIVTNNYRHSLSLMNNRIKYGVDISGLGGLAVGYTDGTYSSTAMVRLGDGMICVLAGDYSNDQRHDLAQIIASGISAYTDENAAGYVKGDVKKGTVTGSVDIDYTGGHNYAVYVYYGGYYTVYGKGGSYEHPP